MSAGRFIDLTLDLACPLRLLKITRMKKGFLRLQTPFCRFQEGIYEEPVLVRTIAYHPLAKDSQETDSEYFRV